MGLDVWEARRVVRVLGEGRSRPLVIECERRDADAQGYDLASASVGPRQFVVKSPGHPSVVEASLFQEALGNQVARLLGIETPAPVLVAFSQAFVRSAQSKLPPEIRLRGEWGIGCEYLPGLKPLVPDFALSATLAPQARQIFACDLLCSNPDRAFGNPNCGLLQGRLVAYDFDCAFTPRGVPAWAVSDSGIASDHLFRNRLQGILSDWNRFEISLARLDEAALRMMAKDLPPEWMASAPRVFDHLLEACDRKARLLVELETALRML